MATREGLDRGISAALDKALAVTIAQLADADTVLLQMRIGLADADYAIVRSNVLLALATNYSALANKSRD